MRERFAHQTKSAIFLHLVWATWDRLPLLVPDVRRAVYRAASAKCAELDVDVVAIGGIEDHVHLLARMPVTLSAAHLVKHLKGASAHLVTHQIAPGQSFKWQRGYGAVSVCPRHIAKVQEYIARQREHHRDGPLYADWEPDE